MDENGDSVSKDHQVEEPCFVKLFIEFSYMYSNEKPLI